MFSLIQPRVRRNSVCGIEVLSEVLAIAGEVFEQPVYAEDDFFSLGGDSVVAVEFALALEERLDRPVDMLVLTEVQTFAELARKLTDDATAGTSPRTSN
jgi:acyl carrier protein